MKARVAFSVLMSVYIKEKPEYLEKSLLSVINQTLPPDEIVLIEDGPLTEELYAVIEKVRALYSALRTYSFKQNVKLGRALSKGVELCSHELVARMDTDDIAEQTRFEIQAAFMESHPDVSVVGAYVEEFCEDTSYSRIKVMPEHIEEIHKYARYRNPLNHMTVMFRKTAVLAAGNYRHFPLLEDYDLWLRMLAGGFVVSNIPRVLVRARTDEEIYNRRGGRFYFEQYMKLRKEQKRLGLLNRREYTIAVCLSYIMTIQPAWLRKLLYQNVLRRQR